MNKTYFKEDDVILSTMDFNFLKDKSAKTFHIAYGIDKNFLFGCGVSIASILLSNPDINLEFHVFTDHFNDAERHKFEALAQQYHSRIVVYLVNCDSLKLLPSTRNWTYATYFRFIIADYFANKTDKVLYLDADIACKNSLQELVDLKFEEHEIAAVVTEGSTEWWTKRSISLSTPGLVAGYFNAGFLLINIPQWMNENITSKAIEMLRDPEVTAKITHLDQDVLNMLLVGKSRYVDKKFNTQYSINYELKGAIENPVTQQTVLIHYIGPTKPWHAWANYPVSEPFLKAKEKSPWNAVSLLQPSNSMQYRYAAKHFANLGNYLSCARAWCSYYLKKIA